MEHSDSTWKPGTVSSRRRGALVAAALIITSTAVPLSVAPAGAQAAPGWRDVVVTGPSGAADAVVAAGGEVIASLPVAGGVAARLPGDARLDSRWFVAPQRELRVAAASGTTPAVTAATLRDTLGLPDGGTGGAGVTVAVVDTGIADVPDLAGRVTRRLDFTGTGDGDGYGHGTFMAGLIAGSGAASGGAYRGVAPAASLIDIKVADATGSTDLITVLRGLQWVSEHSRQVDVLNLSLSSGSTLPYQVDPLNQALRSLWYRGVTVVVPSGNDGPDAGTVTAPGNDPLLLTVGGLDDGGTAGRDDDVVGVWSGRGPTFQGDAKPDLVAPGGHVVSLRSPGSVVDTTAPQARVGDQYFKGSGTSMATAVASGIVAVALAEQPKLRPDSVKSLFTGTAYAAPGLTRAAGGGSGGLDAARILKEASKWRSTGAEHAQTRDMATLARDAKQWAAFETVLLKGDAAAATAAWEKLSPASRDWAARSWAQLDPAARSWAARAWAARSWAGAGEEWAARSWAARSWATRTWAADEWTARAWAARSWAGADWAARSWASDRWSARSWAWIHADR
ncbi:serine protease AprX [Catenuloplanes nepalensis]|uniref:Serine protease AprX n=1 Tax=Catenuloplanes nepalensis TaxID=587533 RepID=A0ABT9MNR6_9ACTN|nr:S8 family serine peptidase [Catenuloplanes nepalensis]MDP9793088.1 serine protease AprX [Catenuloplanes nepalensis]